MGAAVLCSDPQILSAGEARPHMPAQHSISEGGSLSVYSPGPEAAQSLTRGERKSHLGATVPQVARSPITCRTARGLRKR